MSDKTYAYLPEDLLLQMLEKAPQTAEQLAKTIDINEAHLNESRTLLEKNNFIRKCGTDGEITESVMAADGACIIEHKTSADILLAMAVGVDGLSKKSSTTWPDNSRQYQQWQSVVPHHVANTRLAQGIMFLMELSILAETDREIRIMDGSHLTSILKLNSLLSPNDQNPADTPYVTALSDFLKENYKKIIPDIPDIINNAFSQKSIISLTKYTSSREIIDSQLKQFDIIADDKTFMSTLLKENEYTKPIPVGQSKKDNAMWKQIHIKCNLPIQNVKKSDLEEQLENAIAPLKVTDEHESELYFCYYKPLENTMAHRIELKKSLAENSEQVEFVLRSLKKQIVFPEIREPYPQFLADIIAKNIYFGMEAVNQAVFSASGLNQKKHFDLILPYRTS